MSLFWWKNVKILITFKSRPFFPHFPTVHIFVMLDCYQTFKMSVVSSFINTFLPGKTIVLIYHIDIDILLINGYWDYGRLVFTLSVLSRCDFLDKHGGKQYLNYWEMCNHQVFQSPLLTLYGFNIWIWHLLFQRPTGCTIFFYQYSIGIHFQHLPLA